MCHHLIGSAISCFVDLSHWLVPRYLSSKESTLQCRRCAFDPRVRKIPYRRKWQPTAWKIPWSEEPVGLQSPKGCRESYWAIEHTHWLHQNNCFLFWWSDLLFYYNYLESLIPTNWRTVLRYTKKLDWKSFLLICLLICFLELKVEVWLPQ